MLFELQTSGRPAGLRESRLIGPPVTTRVGRVGTEPLAAAGTAGGLEPGIVVSRATGVAEVVGA